MWHVPVVWCISAVATVTPLLRVIESRQCETTGEARGWLLERLRRYPPGYQGKLLARLERYTTDGRDARSTDVDVPTAAPAMVRPTGSAMLTLAGDCYRIGGWLKCLAWTRDEWVLVRDLHDMGGRLGRMADTFGGQKPTP